MSPLKPGSRLKSAVCDTEVMVVRAQALEVALHCGGAQMIAMDQARPEGMALDPLRAAGTLVGKRYVDAQDKFEFLCTKGGKGSLTLDGNELTVKLAKALPSSD